MKFAYQARAADGTVTKGTLDVDSEQAAIARLRESGMRPMDISPAGRGLNMELGSLSFGGRVKPQDLAIFARQFATMHASGLPMSRALNVLKDQTSNELLKKALTSVKADVEAGTELSTAMARHPKVFPELTINMIRAGETGGFLDQALNSTATQFEAEVRLRSQVKSAITYPMVVFIFAMLAAVGLLLFIVPRFKSMFDSLGGTLPLATRIMLSLSELLQHGMPALIAAGFAVGWAWRRYGKHPQVRNVVDPLKLKLPVFGPLLSKIALVRFSRNLAALLTSGVPILHALDIVADTSGSMVLSKAVHAVRDQVRTGRTISEAMADQPIFPPMVIQMMSVGEDAGSPDEMLAKVADFYDQQVEATTKALSSLIEPLMIVGIGLMVGCMVIAIYLPMFSVFDQIK